MYKYTGMSKAEFAALDYQQRAKALVDGIEDVFNGTDDIKTYWELVNKASNFILDKGFESGMMTKDVYEELKKRYKYYVPLRGFDEYTNRDYFAYLTSSPYYADIMKVQRGRS